MLKELKFNINPNYTNIHIRELNKHFDPVMILDSNSEFNSKVQTTYSKLIALGTHQEFRITKTLNMFSELQEFYDNRNGWLFGYFTYDFKNRIEKLSSNNLNMIYFPELKLFSPEIVIQIIGSSLILFFDNDLITQSKVIQVYKMLFATTEKDNISFSPAIELQNKITREEYINSVIQLKQHIQNGDIYEINFCHEFFAKNAEIDTVNTFTRLNEISHAPFSAYCKFHNHYLLCASPERFMQRVGNRLISQPIKGTKKRSQNQTEDLQLKEKLRNDEKERIENIMIVDLVRNDLSKIAKKESVNVDELCEIYSYKQVHQMISTISCEIEDKYNFVDIIKSMFPMGSMTGSPKVSAMKLIENYESSLRGLYSGTIGYVNPEGDFDFNVIIRSILYNQENKNLSFMV
ncbi:MAG: anthranilate synthase component I family protein [Bacteroidota bacterium]